MIRNLRRRWPLLLVLVVVVLGIYTYFSGTLPFVGMRGGSASAPVSGAGSPGAVTAVSGAAFSFGTWEYTVVDAKRGGELSGRTARGSFFLVTLRVRNTGREPQGLKPADFALLDGQGRRFTPDDEGTKAAASGRKDDLFAGAVQPGLTGEGVLVFDVPPDLKEPVLRLTSGYVDVRLSQ